MPAFMLPFLLISLAFGLLVLAGLLYYIRVALKKRVALAPGWSFDRDEQPVRFWLQISAVGLGAFHWLAEMVLGAIKLYEIGFTF